MTNANECAEQPVEGGFVPACEIDDIPVGRGLGLRVADRYIALFRDGDEVFALEDVCPHAGMPLSGGCFDGKTVVCPWHGWPFHVRTGFLPGAEEFTVPTFEVRLQGTRVMVRVAPTC